MQPDPNSDGSSAGVPGRPDPQVLLFMQSGRNRELLQTALDVDYAVETSTAVEDLDMDFDCCVFDFPAFNRVAGTVQEKRDTSRPVFLPFVVLIDEDRADRVDAGIWEYVDDVIELPTSQAALQSRIANLIERRQTAARLADREAELAETVRDLKLKERAMDAAPVGITIAEPGEDGEPLIYANAEFERLTGYSEEVIGADCRFLQGEDTEPETRAELRAAIDAAAPVSVDILNYRKSGASFWNKLDIAPIFDDGGTLTHYVGFQTDITGRKVRERRLEVLTRVLNHNMRNSMNVIEGHVELLSDRFDDDIPDSLSTIERTARNLMGLADSVRDIERTLQLEAEPDPIPLEDHIRRLISGFEDRYPTANLDLSVTGTGSDDVNAPGILAAVEEAIENGIKHNDSAEPTVDIRLRTTEPGWIDIVVEDDGQGIPEREVEVLDSGETPLNHADRLGLWLIYWVVRRAGGSLSIEENDRGGTELTMSIPTVS